MLNVIVEENNYSRFVELLDLASKQVEYKLLFGSFWFFLASRCKKLIYLLFFSKRKSDYVLVYYQGRLVAGLEMTERGEIGSLVITTNKRLRNIAVLKLVRETLQIIDQSEKIWVTRTFNKRLLKPLKKLDFKVCRDKSLTITTVRLWIFKFSFITDASPVKMPIFRRFITSHELFYLKKIIVSDS